MAGSDKKEQKFASSESTSGTGELLVVQDPDVSGFVLAGNPLGLIPRAKLNTDQKTTINAWSGALPPGGRSDKIRLQIARGSSNEWTTLEEHTFTNATWVPLDFTILSTFFLQPENEGPFDLRYQHENYLGTPDVSARVRIHIDKIPPNGAIPPSKMVFTVTQPITETAFVTDDFLEAEIPGWTGDSADVQVAFGWRKGELPEDPAEIVLIGPQPIVTNGKVRIPKAAFEREGDGLCCGGYVLIDKAGNISALSLYELMSVAMGVLPVVPLSAPRVTDATGGELLRSDIIDGGVEVTFGRITNGKSTDQIAVRWGANEVDYKIPVGANPSGGFKFFVPWDHILKEYGAAKGVVDTDLQYIVYRGVEPYISSIVTVKCNLSVAGPDNPNPEPGNPNLKTVEIVGKSGVPNKLIDTDEDEDIFASIELVAPLADGDTYQVMWNGTPIGAPYVIDVADDTAGGKIEIALDWDVIRGEGPNAAMPVWYVLSNADHENLQEPEPRTNVDIDWLVLKLPDAEPLHTNAAGIVTCNSLRWNAGRTSYGIEYRIPPSSHLDEHDEVNVVWNAYMDFDNPTVILPARKEHTFPDITAEQARNGIVWLIEPYATHVLPIWSKTLPLGKGEVTYTITGKPASSDPTNTEVGLSQGEGSCNVPD